MDEVDQRAPAPDTVRPSHLRLGEILIRRGFIGQDDLALALSQQDLEGRDVPLGRHLVNLGAISDDTLTEALSEQSGLSVVDLRERAPDRSATDRVAPDVARRLRALPIEHHQHAIVVAVAEPPTRELRREIGRQLGVRAEFVLAVPGALDDAIDEAYPISRVAPFGPGPLDLVPATGAVYVPMPEEPSDPPTPAEDVGGDDAAITWLLALVHDLDAVTAIHVQNEADGTRVRARADGELTDLLMLQEPVGTLLVGRILAASGVEAELGTARQRVLRCVDATFAPALHVTAAPTLHGVSIVIRPTDRVPTIGDDASLVALEPVLESVVNGRRGLVVVGCTDDARRRTLLRSISGKSSLRSKSVGAVDLVDDDVRPLATVLATAGLDSAEAVRLASELDHDLVVVDVSDDDVLRAAVEVALAD